MKHTQYRTQQVISLILCRAFYGLLTAVLAASGEYVGSSIMRFLSQIAGTNGHWLLLGLGFSATVLLLDAFLGFITVFIAPNSPIIKQLCGLGNIVRPWLYLPAMFCFMAFCYISTDYGLTNDGCALKYVVLFCREWLTMSIFMGVMATFALLFALHESFIANEKLRNREDVCHLT